MRTAIKIGGNILQWHFPFIKIFFLPHDITIKLQNSFTDDFIGTLDEQSIQRAKDELNEDEKNRQGAVETFREWVIQQQWLKTPTDTRFLLRFLRPKKYSQLESRKAIEQFWRSRSQIPEWCSNKDPRDPVIQDVLSKGFVMRLPKADKDGRIYLLQRAGCMDVDYIKNKLGGPDAIFKTFSVIVDWITMDPRAQVNGMVGILDLTGYGIQHKLVLHTMENIRKMSSMMQSNPMRVKGLHAYNLPPAFEAVLALIKTFLKPKLRDRVRTHGRTLVSLYEDIDMSVLPKEYLPDDYPCWGTLEEIIEYNKQEILKQPVVDHIMGLTQGDYGVDLKLKPSGEDVPSESFRKLNVD
ncbi:retinaldehyde-binding protein 1-like [Mercenaria mercenaria]|uniref:retinaldehyde-binding protein 1-like n=1 Tax=Mercenaria mercenaria TaxID=6596 RepID=UPI00234F0BD5|nr:retinaldehyde-binding protein 1-like [Mercenaria mercenaria]